MSRRWWPGIWYVAITGCAPDQSLSLKPRRHMEQRKTKDGGWRRAKDDGSHKLIYVLHLPWWIWLVPSAEPWQDGVFAKFSAEMEPVLQRMEASCSLSTGRAAQGFGCVLWMKPMEGCAKDVVGSTWSCCKHGLCSSTNWHAEAARLWVYMCLRLVFCVGELHPRIFCKVKDSRFFSVNFNLVCIISLVWRTPYWPKLSAWNFQTEVVGSNSYTQAQGPVVDAFLRFQISSIEGSGNC